MNDRTKKISILAMLSALAYLVMFFGRIPVVMFLKYDPKDVIIVIGGFLFGPASAFIISAVVSLVEMVTASSTGHIGLIMNILSSVAFACTASYIYQKNRTIKNAALGLAAGVVLSTLAMLLWNYMITPYYTGWPREEVVPILLPVILPFNLAKGIINSAFTMILYKPIVSALRKSGFVAEREEKKLTWGVVMASSAALVSGVLFFMILGGVIK